MESNCTNCNENVYFACRKKAASYNEKLNSRESAAELLGISPSTLANHELGITKSVPVDTVVMMADLYKAPELKNMYCKKECPIGKGLPVSTNIDSLQGITVRLLNGLDDEEIHAMKKRLISIAADGILMPRKEKTWMQYLNRWTTWQRQYQSLGCLQKNSQKGGNGYGAY